VYNGVFYTGLPSFFVFHIALPRPLHGASTQDFQQGSTLSYSARYVSPETLKRVDLYINRWILDWWRCEFPLCSVDDLVEFVTRGYYSYIQIFGPLNNVRIIRDS